MYASMEQLLAEHHREADRLQQQARLTRYLAARKVVDLRRRQLRRAVHRLHVAQAG